MNLRLVPLVLLLAGSLAGCLNDDSGPAATDADTDAAWVGSVPDTWEPAYGIDTEMLSPAEHSIAPLFEAAVPSELDGARMWVQIFLPEGEGPWPTIFEHSPYRAGEANGLLHILGESIGLNGPGLVEEYVPRGYAVVLGQVRGTGNSEGCYNHMGHAEQIDSASIVEWIADQGWSDGKVAMYGISYLGTTPHQALVQAPEHLVTVVTGAGVTNQWRNTFQNGVPYQGRFYPVTYNAYAQAPATNVQDPISFVGNNLALLCDQEDGLHSMTPGMYEEGIYTSYWHERNLTAQAANAKASILYSQGAIDRAVNPMEAVFWFNDLDVPKKALIHQAGHQWPGRVDYDTIELAWFDYWLKGIDNGVMSGAPVESQTNDGRIRLDTHWPPVDTQALALYLAPSELTRAPPSEGSEVYIADMARNAEPTGLADAVLDAAVEATFGAPVRLAYQSAPLEADVHLSGVPWMHLNASVDAHNTYFLTYLYDVAPDGTWSRVQEAWMNAHLWDGFEHSSPLTPGADYEFDFRFEPREWVFAEGHSIGLRIEGYDRAVFPVDTIFTRNTINYGPDGSWVELPVVVDPVVYDAGALDP